ncbi:MAG: hypothetical protein ACI9FJ_001438 [Alteromonadaceae bacterium]|jgi:hypothetical protein
MVPTKVNFYQQPEMDEYTEDYEGQTYRLVPESHITATQLYEQKFGYEKLNKVSRAMFERKEVLRETTFNQTSLMRLKSVLPKDLCEIFMQQSVDNKASLYHADFMNSLLPLILTDEIDSLLCSFFQSEYTLFWYSYLETTPDRESRSYSSHWHCDGGPEKHLKMLIYLNRYEDHLGNTKFYDKPTTTKLKEAGYIFGSIKARTDELGPLGRGKNIPLNEIMYEDIEAGDALLFAPQQLAHIGKIPKTGTRHVLQLCFIPSPYPWQFTKDKVLHTQTRCMEFEGAPITLLNYANKAASDTRARITVPADGAIRSPFQLHLLLRNIFPKGNFAGLMYTRLIEADPGLQHVGSLDKLLMALKRSFEGSVNWDGELGVENIQNLVQLANYEEEIRDSVGRYAAKDKPDPTAVFWPSPVHPDKPASKFNLLPYVQKYPIMDMNTPIGSAGSCFAFEIARVFQEKGYNYVITERNDDPNSGMLIDGYNPGDKYAKFCANYGILFNTPSFRQMAERAFAIKPTRQILFQQADGGWLDPYRENVLFYSHQAYLDDYDRHIAACRKSLEEVEVFIITLGLNECWEFRDGTVMSRNPRSNMYPLVKHKTLTVEENVDNIQIFYDIVRQHNPNFKLIISVSPIPFLATGKAKEQHIIAANTHSKAVLRVAAEALTHNNEHMYYLPSYELVTECIEDAWGADDRHVKPTTVEQVVEMFKQIFIKTGVTG